MARCLVTGGAGFIGSHLVERLLEEGYTVRVLDDFSTGKRSNVAAHANRIELIDGTITDPATVRAAVDGCELVFHLAALPSVKRSVENPAATHVVCATGTFNVLDAARGAGAKRLVYAASSSAYGDTPGSVRSETDALSPLSPYAAAKLAGELYCRSFTKVFGLETVRLRFFNIFGPRQDADSPYSGVIPIFAKTMRAGRRPRVEGDGLQSRDFTYVTNAVDAVLRAAAAPAAVGNVYNIGAGGSTALLELVRLLNEILGTRLAPEHGPPRPGDVRHSQANIEAARRDLGYEPTVSFAEGLRRTVETRNPTR
jgi:UDP-glucose 4-epimerase